MKKLIYAVALASVVSLPSFAQQRALYVKQGNSVTKYNFGVAGDLVFSNGGKTLNVSGYKEVIDLTEIDYISLKPETDGVGLTPNAQKDKLMAVGEEVNKRVDMNANSDVIKMFDAFFRKNMHKYGIDRKYWDVHNAINNVAKAVSNIAGLKTASCASLRSAVADLYKLSDYYGVFTANTVSWEWEKTADSDSYLEFVFPGYNNETYKIHIEGSGDVQTWSHPDANLELPSKITLTFYENANPIASGSVAIATEQDKVISLTAAFSTGTYAVINDLTIKNDGIDDKITIGYKGENVVNITNRIDGKNLLDYAEMYDAVKAAEHSHDQFGNCMDDGDFAGLYAHFIRAQSNVDVLGKLQLKALAFNFVKLDEAMGEDTEVPYQIEKDGKLISTFGEVVNWNPNTGMMRITRDARDAVAKKAKYLCNYVDAPFFYDGASEMQGYLSWNEYTESYEGWLGSDGDNYKYGYVIIDGMLVQVENRLEYNSDKGADEWSGWFYYAYPAGEEAYTELKVSVSDADVIHPSQLREEYYDFNPVIVFPDMTSFMIPDYFTRSAFNTLVEDYNLILDTYFAITGAPRH